jgi:hypothetical protein
MNRERPRNPSNDKPKDRSIERSFERPTNIET